MGDEFGDFLYAPKPKRRKRVVPGEDVPAKFAIEEEEQSSLRKRGALWCKTCSKYRLPKEIDFEHYLYKEQWWRKIICKHCDAVLKDEALE